MVVVEAIIGRRMGDVWRAFVDTDKLPQWVPGLRDARVIEEGPEGLPLEIQFEFVTGSIYSLVYAYDFDAHTISWMPRVGELDGISGSATFEDNDRGTKFTYANQQSPGRRAIERAIDDPHDLVAAFQRFMETKK